MASEYVNGIRADRFVGLQPHTAAQGDEIEDLPDELYCSNPALPPLTVGEIQHDPLHAELIEARARETGLGVVAVLPKVRSADAEASPGGRRELLQFFLQRLTGDSLPSQ